jgi:hypothetical protein
MTEDRDRLGIGATSSGTSCLPRTIAHPNLNTCQCGGTLVFWSHDLCEGDA